MGPEIRLVKWEPALHRDHLFLNDVINAGKKDREDAEHEDENCRGQIKI